jgi:hypothetical protein
VSRSAKDHELATERSVTLRLESFAWDTIEREAAREGLTAAELIAFSVLYYLADMDSGRISRRISRSPYPRLLEDRFNGDLERWPASLPETPANDPD